MIKNKTKKEAAALKYNPESDDVPYIAGIGQGIIAEKIIKTAAEKDIPLVEDKNLAHMLNKLSAGDEIPEELYGLVAQVLVFVAGLDREYGQRLGL